MYILCIRVLVSPIHAHIHNLHTKLFERNEEDFVLRKGYILVVGLSDVPLHLQTIITMANLEDYSEEWLAAIEKSIGDIEYHQILINTLSTATADEAVLPPTTPPPFMPPRRPSAHRTNQENGQVHPYATINKNVKKGGVSSNPYVPVTNAFANLSLDDEGNSGKRKGPQGNHQRRSTQVRYLRVRAECGYAECIRNTAVEAGKNREWLFVPDRWQDAYGLINRTLADTDEWWAILLSANDSHPRVEHLQDNHSFLQLTELFQALTILEESTERERQDALKLLDKNLKRVQAKLDPLKDSRQDAMNAMGKQRWSNNPAPKMDYAEKMRLLGVEEKELMFALQVLQELQLHL